MKFYRPSKYYNPGYGVRFKNGLRFGFTWMTDGSGHPSSKTRAVLATLHRPTQHHWRWSITWRKPARLFEKLKFSKSGLENSGSYNLRLPLVGAFSYSWQKY